MKQSLPHALLAHRHVYAWQRMGWLHWCISAGARETYCLAKCSCSLQSSCTQLRISCFADAAFCKSSESNGCCVAALPMHRACVRAAVCSMWLRPSGKQLLYSQAMSFMIWGVGEMVSACTSQVAAFVISSSSSCRTCPARCAEQLPF
jgi:hypothetical protein